jgi:hypothetical protein
VVSSNCSNNIRADSGEPTTDDDDEQNEASIELNFGTNVISPVTSTVHPVHNGTYRYEYSIFLYDINVFSI